MVALPSFPDPVDERAARTVAAVVALLSLLTLATGWSWLLVVLAYDFVARAVSGPALSPLGRFAVWFARRRLGAPRYVAGPPKRFAQSLGAVATCSAAVCALVLGWDAAAAAIVALLAVLATLEAAFALCVGCKVYGLLTSAGRLRDDACVECADAR